MEAGAEPELQRTIDEQSFEREPKRAIRRKGAAVVAGFGAVGLFTALLTSYGCGTTDGSFAIDDPLARPSGVCRTTHFPGFPDSLGSLGLIVALYLGPALVVIAGSILAVRLERERLLWISAFLAGGLALGSIIVASEASVGYAGFG